MPEECGVVDTEDIKEQAKESFFKLTGVSFDEMPNSATNGDVIKTLFPNAKIEDNNILYIKDDVNGYYTPINEKWWNKLYNDKNGR